MPLVRVDIIKGKTEEYKTKLLNCIHEGLIETIGIEDWDRFQRIVEIDKRDFETSPDKTDDFMIIEIIMFRGRTKEQKKALIKTITSKLAETLGISATDVFIVIHEPADENWGFAGNQREQPVHKPFEERLAEHNGEISVCGFDWGEPVGREIL